MKGNSIHYLGRKPTGQRDAEGRRTYYVDYRTRCGRPWNTEVEISYASWKCVTCKVCLRRRK